MLIYPRFKENTNALMKTSKVKCGKGVPMDDENKAAHGPLRAAQYNPTSKLFLHFGASPTNKEPR